MAQGRPKKETELRTEAVNMRWAKSEKVILEETVALSPFGSNTDLLVYLCKKENERLKKAGKKK